MHDNRLETAITKRLDETDAGAQAKRDKAAETARAAVAAATLPPDELARRRNRPTLEAVTSAHLNPGDDAA
jgi:hypothetical protein